MTQASPAPLCPRFKMLPKIAILVPLIAAVATPSLALALTDEAVTDVANHLIGVMETTGQAEANSNFVAVRMTTCPVTVPSGASDTVYLYQEQALVENPTEPYRQRFLQIALSEDGERVESHTLRPEATEALTGLCDQSRPTINATALGPPVCTVSLRPSSLGYVGSTPIEGCPVSLGGASYLTNVIVLHSDGMDTWDRGFSADDIQVWGAQAEPYRYRWITPQ